MDAETIHQIQQDSFFELYTIWLIRPSVKNTPIRTRTIYNQFEELVCWFNLIFSIRHRSVVTALSEVQILFQKQSYKSFYSWHYYFDPKVFWKHIWKLFLVLFWWFKVAKGRMYFSSFPSPKLWGLIRYLEVWSIPRNLEFTSQEPDTMDTVKYLTIYLDSECLSKFHSECPFRFHVYSII